MIHLTSSKVKDWWSSKCEAGVSYPTTTLYDRFQGISSCNAIRSFLVGRKLSSLSQLIDFSPFKYRISGSKMLLFHQEVVVVCDSLLVPYHPDSSLLFGFF